MICFEEYRSSPVSALQVEVGEMPLNLRRQQLTAVYWAYLMAQDYSHPIIRVPEKCWEYG